MLHATAASTSRAHPSNAYRSAGGRLRWAGPLVVAASVAANLLLLALATRLLGIGRGFQLLEPAHVALLTALGAAGAVAVYGLLARASGEPERLFRRVALGVLLGSLVPDLLLLANPMAGRLLGATPAGVAVLTLMHLPPAAISVGLLAGVRRRS